MTEWAPGSLGLHLRPLSSESRFPLSSGTWHLSWARWNFNPRLFSVVSTQARAISRAADLLEARVAVRGRVPPPDGGAFLGAESSAPEQASPSSAFLLLSLPLASTCRYVAAVRSVFGLIDPPKQLGLGPALLQHCLRAPADFDFLKRSSRGPDVI